MLRHFCQGVATRIGAVVRLARTYPWRTSGIMMVVLIAMIIWLHSSADVSLRSGASSSIQGSAVKSESADTPASHVGQLSAADSGAGAKASASLGTSAASVQRRVIEQATLSVTLSDAKKVAGKLAGMVTNAGGFVESQQWSDHQSQSVVQMTLRVPEQEFSAFVDAVRPLGEVTSFSQTGQDVTEQYNGLESNIAQLRNEADAYTRLYGKAQSMQDMLQIQQALSQVNSKVEELSTQLHDLNRSVQLATVNLYLSSVSPTAANSRAIPVVSAMYQSVHMVGRTFVALLTFTAWLTPWGLLLALGVWLWRVCVRRFRHRQLP